MGLRREMGSFYGWMVRSIKESSLQGLFQGMGFINGMMGECMRENGRRIKWMEGECFRGLMEGNTRESM